LQAVVTRSAGTILVAPRQGIPLVASIRQGRWSSLFWALLGLAMLLRILAMWRVTLIPEEAYYWMYAQHPSLSYFDHPPMVAWVIGLGTRLFGQTEFGVRIVGGLMMLATSALLYAYARLWFSRGAALAAAVALQVLPVFFGVGFVATMDGPLLFFWTLCLLGGTLALKRGEVWGWYVAGLALGAALLSKYTAIFLPAGIGLAVLLHPAWRRKWLRSPHPNLAMAIAAGMFSPVVIWNARHDWASFRFQFVDRYADAGFEIGHPLEFLGLQLAVFTPLVLWVALALYGRLLWRRPRRLIASPRWLFAVCLSAPLLAVTSWKSLRYSIHINWTLPALLSLLPAVAQITLAAARSPGWSAASSAANWRPRALLHGLAWTAMVCVLVDVVIMSFLIFGQPRLRWIPAFGDWRALAAIVDDQVAQVRARTGREPLVVARGTYRLASALAFYRSVPSPQLPRPSQTTTSQWVFGGEGLGFPYWMDPGQIEGANSVLLVETRDKTFDHARKWFDSFEPVHDPRLGALPKPGYRLGVGIGLKEPASAPP
jgi:dolichol-phosphate mannosyltransferase